MKNVLFEQRNTTVRNELSAVEIKTEIVLRVLKMQ